MPFSPQRALTPVERRDWLRLARTERVGPVTFRQLMGRYPSAAAALEALPRLSTRGGSAKPLTPPPVSRIEDEIAALERLGGRFIAACEPDYPTALAAIEDAPPLLAVRGHAGLLNRRCIALVGARNASLNGRKMAETLARDLGREGFVVASGLARGVDASAHEASLPTGTVAAVAGGVDVVYPPENKNLYDRLVEAGAIVSDQPVGCEPKAQLFPKRNRIIAGLSLGVVVVEAARQSGSLITARMALDQGREVFAVPGSPLDPRAGGSNDLLRQGAVLTESVADILRHIHSAPTRLLEAAGLFDDAPPDLPDEAAMDAVREKILEFLGPSPVAVDELIRRCQTSASVVLSVLLELELAGRLDRQPGHRVALLA